jgi:signal transduction histidine kinase
MTRPSVLLVEDESAIVELLRAVVEPLRADVRNVSDVKAAVEELDRERPSVLLLDLVLSAPDADGFRVLEHMRKKPQLESVPVIVMSGVADSVAVARAYELGAIDFVSKPFTLTVLSAKLAALLRMARPEERRSSHDVGKNTRAFAHEVRNPLAAIAAAAQVVARDDCMPETRRRLCKAIESEANRVVGLVQQYVDRRQDVASPNGVDLRALCGEILELNLVGSSARTRVHLEPGDQAERVRGNAARLKQVVLNLVLNAVRATEAQGEIRLSINCEDNGVVLRVIDSGSGIAAADLEHIFEENFSTHGGGGLGLPIVKSIVAEHRGKIDVESEPGKGTTFRIWLPV